MFLLYFLSLLAIGVKSYNLDVKNFQLFEDPQGNKNGSSSYFGFSVALYASGSDSVLLVGAPRANSTTTRGLVEPGAVYSCHLGSRGACTEWPIDTTPQFSNRGQALKVKLGDHAWLGATISVQNTTGAKVAVCAPRLTNTKLLLVNQKFQLYEEFLLMNGMCYSTPINSSSSFTQPAMRKHKPFSNDRTEQTIKLQKSQLAGQVVFHQGMGQLGFSLHQTPEIHSDFILGAPGYHYWTGTTVFIDERDQRDSRRAVIPNVAYDSRLDFNDYLGYSVTSGRFYKLEERLYASGAPRSANTFGKVFIHSFPSRYASIFSFRKVFEGEQHGEYFGASLTSCDVNGDDRDDLIVGAPLWSKESDEGRVYIYRTKGQVDFEVQKIEGEHDGARFGTVVSCLNDLDFDGHGDVAVGAPYEDNERGAVYIFNGSPEGLSSKPSQRIRAVDLSPNLLGFGYAISEPRDVDGNRFPDVAVGAYLSGHSVVLRSRHVVTLNMKLVKSQNFTLLPNASLFMVDVCTSYNGPFAPESFNVTKTLTVDRVHKRAIDVIYRVMGKLRKGKEKCESIRIRLKKNILNVKHAIEIMGNIAMYEDSACSHCPVINLKLSKISDNLKLAYSLDCGADEVCHADLRVTITSASNDDDRFLIGSNSTYNITIFVENTKEPAYATQAHLYIPSPITLSRVPVGCEEKPEIDKILEVICNLGSPLRLANNITLELDMRAIQHHEKYNEIQVMVDTQSEEENTSNNRAMLNINYDIDAHITIAGKADGYSYSVEDQDLFDKKLNNVTINQIYEIWKIGVTPISETVVIINVPTLWKKQKIANVKQVRVSIDGQIQGCDVLLDEESHSKFYEIDMDTNTGGNNSLVIPSAERTFFINCTDQYTACQKFKCQVGPLLKPQSLATLTMTIEFILPNATEKEYEGKNIIYFVTEGFVKISNLNLTESLMTDLFDYNLSATSLSIRRQPEQVAMWVIIASVLLGIILFMLLAFLLKKVGFFNRRSKEELDALRSTQQQTAVDED